MRIVVDLEKEDFINALEYEDIKEVIEFYLYQEYQDSVSINDFLELNKNNLVVEISDTFEFDVDESFARLLDKYNIPYSRFILIDEDNEIDDINSINDAKDIFSDLDVYSLYQSSWV